jgi:hypothetical protein
MIKSKKAELFTRSAEVTMRGMHCSSEQIRHIRRIELAGNLPSTMFQLMRADVRLVPGLKIFSVRSLLPKLLWLPDVRADCSSVSALCSCDLML